MHREPLPGRSGKLLAGVVHLLALPGSPRGMDLESEVLPRALDDARALGEGGIDAVLLENYGDLPFVPGPVGAETVAAMTRIAVEIRRALPVRPLGLNILRNDAAAALAAAHASGADFVRINVHAGAALTDQGIIEGRARDTLELRRRLGAERIRLWADLRVKHAAPLAPRPLEEEARDLAYRSLADAILLTGPATGCGVDLDELHRIKEVLRDRPVLAASGVTTESVREILETCDGVIVGSALCRGGVAGRGVEAERVRDFVRAARG